jgi:6-pyruvoyltetrahydropterin/6-carboxytetrahydropterin synthase
MYLVTVLSHFAAAHCLRHLHGKCESLHGHNWKVEVCVASKRLGKGGIVLDFGILKRKVEEVLDTLDHTYLNEHPYFLKREPSSENIARYIYEEIDRALGRRAAGLRSVTAWESESAFATYLGRGR